MEINTITAIMAVVLLCMVARGYAPLLSFGLARWVNWVIGGVIIIISTIAIHLIYWDLVQYFSGTRWPDIRDAFGGQAISAIFNVSTMVACVALLQGRKMLIPIDERHKWHWWNAWLHPSRGCRFSWRKRK
tara:strand:- start:223 stop:615 length:393 start_codon:yes stop_codon:yes gene_type:complete